MRFKLLVVVPSKRNQVVAEICTDDINYWGYAEAIQKMMQPHYDDKIRVDIYDNGKFFAGTM